MHFLHNAILAASDIEIENVAARIYAQSVPFRVPWYLIRSKLTSSQKLSEEESHMMIYIISNIEFSMFVYGRI